MTATPSETLLVLEGPPGFGPVVEGEALVTGDAFSPRYDLDRATGEISRRGHRAEGQNVRDKVLVVTTSKGGVAAGWAFYDLKRRGLAPRALICRSTNSVFVQGCVLANIPILHRLEPDPLEALCTGDRVRVEPQRGRVLVLERSPSR
jgi:predicted aconitase with swiveling domain